MTTIRRRTPRLSEQGGFTLAVSMGIMLIASIVSVAAFQAANGDLTTSADNSDRKVAFAAAESGVAWYLSKLAANPDYWQLCDTGVTGGVADPVHQATPPTTGRRWKVVSGTGTRTADFSVSVLPAAPATACNTADPASMISTTDGTFKIRSTGRYRGETRSVITSFKRARFLDFLYFTDYETLDPDIQGGGNACRQYRAQRAASGFNCTPIQFAGNDRVNGPLHTNDDIIYCGNASGPIFGRGSDDNIHVSGPAPGQARNSGCGTTNLPQYRGTFRPAQPPLQMPPTNAELRVLTAPGFSGQGYRLSGTQYIRFTGNSMTVDTPAGNPQSVPLPPNGVIYVEDTGGCVPGSFVVNVNGNNINVPRTPRETEYGEGTGCPNVYVSGTANRSVTLASERDIIVAPTLATTSANAADQFDPRTAGNSGTPASNDANVIAAGALNTTTQQLSGNVNIGLIANGYVRVYHRVDSFPATNKINADNLSQVGNVRIDAAILSLQHSFIVDNWGYAPSPGTLTTHGAIAQRFRGPVGTGTGATISTGYVKDYWYDNRLRYRSPPYFLDPVDSGWLPGRQNELVPAV